MNKFGGQPYRDLSVTDVQAMRDRGEQFQLIDVREPNEHAIARIEGATLLPLSQAQSWANTLPRDQPIVIFCHHGGRSQQIATILATQLGYTNLANMVGGIELWAREIDPTIARY